MLKWISKALGNVPMPTAEANSSTWANAFEKVIAPITRIDSSKVRSSLIYDLRSYVLTGHPVSVLAEIATIPEVGSTLRITGYSVADNAGTIDAFYRVFDAVPADVALRWTRVLEAAGGQSKHRLKIQMPDGSHWAEVLLMHSAGTSLDTWTSHDTIDDKLSAPTIEQLLVEAALPPSALLVAAFTTPIDGGYGVERQLRMVGQLKQIGEAIDRHLEAIRPSLMSSSVNQRVHVARMLGKASVETRDHLATEITELACCNSKQVRASAEALILECGPAIVEALKAMATKGKPDQRVNALRLLWLVADRSSDLELKSFARESALSDKAPSAQSLLGEWDSIVSTNDAPAIEYDYAVPVIEWKVDVTPALNKALDSLQLAMNQSVHQGNRQAAEYHARMKAQGKSVTLYVGTEFSDTSFARLRDYLRSEDAVRKAEGIDNRQAWRHSVTLIPGLATQEGMTPVALQKILTYLGIGVDQHGILNYPAANAFNEMHRAKQQPSLLELSLILEGQGFPASGLMRNYCHGWGGSIAAEWPAESVWPFFAKNIDLLIQGLTQNLFKDYSTDRKALFRAVGTFPAPPPVLVNALFDLALGPGKTDRPFAQEALARQPDKKARIIAALGDGKSDARAVAAQWLARLRHEPAIAALEAAVAKEKHDVAKGAMLDALQSFGRPVEKYLDRKALESEAEKLLNKGLPKEIEWFPWDNLPVVRWNDSKGVVPSAVIRWLLVQSVRQKSPEPNAVLRKYCAMFEPKDREVLGQFVLEIWIREDIRPIPAEEAQRLAENSAKQTYNYIKQYPQHHQNNPHLGRSEAEITAAYLPALLRQPAGSAIGSKGLLAVAAACAGERASTQVARYLKEYYGTRAAQGKALIAMLAWIEHPSATQLMLSIGSRFRTKSFQEEATRQAEALADRKNWTLAELADRTIPFAGFDETATLELRYGPRSFTAKMVDDFKIELYNPEGKKIAALPEPRQDDDPELAKDAKKAFSGAKKEIKTIVAMQTDRLYEALCTEREWSFADWNLYLNQHPIVRRLLKRLVWTEFRNGLAIQSFRPLDDGTLTDADDNEVTIADDSHVRVAHDSAMSSEAVTQWQQHLIDYKVSPLFQQLGKGTYLLPDSKQTETKISDFEGHLLEAFALRGRSLKLGYTRGPAEDGGWFHVYEKRFPTLGLIAVLEFSGNPLPEENRTVALHNLSFTGTSSGGTTWQRNGMPLSKVPKILLSECYNDLRLIAAEGSGFDPDWQKKSEY